MKKILLAGMTFMFLGVSQQVISMNKNWYFNLQAAAKANDYNAIPYLIDDVQYNVNFQDGNGETALHIAAQEGHSTFIKKLIEKTKANIKVNLKNNTGQTPLHYTVLGKSDSPASVDFLFDNGAYLNAHDKTGNTPLHFAAMLGKINIAGKLIELKADVNAKADDKKTPLHYAAIGTAAWSLEIAKELIKNGAIVNAGDKDGTTPLHIAAGQGSLEIVQELITQGAKVNTLDNDPDADFGGTPLHYAAQNGHLDIVQELVNNHGADVTIKNNKGFTPFDVATDEDVKNFLKSPTTKTSSTFINLKQYFTPIQVEYDYKAGWLKLPDNEYNDSVCIHILDDISNPQIDASGKSNFEYITWRLAGILKFDDAIVEFEAISWPNLYYWKSDYDADKKPKDPKIRTLSNKPKSAASRVAIKIADDAVWPTDNDIKKAFEKAGIAWDLKDEKQHPSAGLWGAKGKKIKTTKTIPKSELEKALTLLKEKLTATSDYLQKLKQKLSELTSKLSGKTVSTTSPKTTMTNPTITTTTPIISSSSTTTTPIISSSGTTAIGSTSTFNVPEVYITIVHADITKQQFENQAHAAIVNAANSKMRGGGGIDGAIHSNNGAGPLLWAEEEVRNLYCPTGDALLTMGHKLAPLRIIHTVGPYGSDSNREDLLKSAYTNCLKLADNPILVNEGMLLKNPTIKLQNQPPIKNPWTQKDIDTAKQPITAIAFNCISTAIFGYNINQATPVAIKAVFDYLKNNPTSTITEIRFVVFCDPTYYPNHADYKIYKKELEQRLAKDTFIVLDETKLTDNNDKAKFAKLHESSKGGMMAQQPPLCFKLTKK